MINLFDGISRTTRRNSGGTQTSTGSGSDSGSQSRSPAESVAVQTEAENLFNGSSNSSSATARLPADENHGFETHAGVNPENVSVELTDHQFQDILGFFNREIANPLREEIAALLATIETLLADNEAVRAENEQLRQDLDEALAAINDLTNQVEEANAANEDLERRVDQTSGGTRFDFEEHGTILGNTLFINANNAENVHISDNGRFTIEIDGEVFYVPASDLDKFKRVIVDVNGEDTNFTNSTSKEVRFVNRNYNDWGERPIEMGTNGNHGDAHIHKNTLHLHLPDDQENHVHIYRDDANRLIIAVNGERLVLPPELENRFSKIKIVGGSENDFMQNDTYYNSYFYGKGGDDILIGGYERDELHGGDKHASEDGDDILMGRGDNDTLKGWLGSDIRIGGAGNDNFDDQYYMNQDQRNQENNDENEVIVEDNI